MIRNFDISLINFAETYAFTCKTSLRIVEKCYMRNLSEWNKEWKVVLHMSCCYKIIQITGGRGGEGGRWGDLKRRVGSESLKNIVREEIRN